MSCAATTRRTRGYGTNGASGNYGSEGLRPMPRNPHAKIERLSDDDYAALLAEQGGRCAIQGCERTPKTRRFHTDHDHRTGQIRGLLCHWHNRIMPRDSAEASALAVYLQDAELKAR
jgi:hypothetical protein